MTTPNGIDKAYADRKKRINKNALTTAQDLSGKMMQFLCDVSMSTILSKRQKKRVRKRLLRRLERFLATEKTIHYD